MVAQALVIGVVLALPCSARRARPDGGRARAWARRWPRPPSRCWRGVAADSARASGFPPEVVLAALDPSPDPRPGRDRRLLRRHRPAHRALVGRQLLPARVSLLPEPVPRARRARHRGRRRAPGPRPAAPARRHRRRGAPAGPRALGASRAGARRAPSSSPAASAIRRSCSSPCTSRWPCWSRWARTPSRTARAAPGGGWRVAALAAGALLRLARPCGRGWRPSARAGSRPASSRRSTRGPRASACWTGAARRGHRRRGRPRRGGARRPRLARPAGAPRPPRSAVVALLAADLLRAGAGLNPATSADFFAPSPEVARHHDAWRAAGRIFTCDPASSRAYARGARPSRSDHERWTFAVLRDTARALVQRQRRPAVGAQPRPHDAGPARAPDRRRGRADARRSTG